ncbi:MAG: hypothetical protein TREMPRED_002020, partial [Tremellales sp. Tagirdzhanova-0007]
MAKVNKGFHAAATPTEDSIAPVVPKGDEDTQAALTEKLNRISLTAPAVPQGDENTQAALSAELDRISFQMLSDGM